MIEPENIAVVLLAAGLSRRFGVRDKLLAKINGEPLVTRTAAAISVLEPGRRIGVCSGEAGETAQLLRSIGFDIVVNPEPGLGLSASLALGVAEAARGPAQAALICLADMPFVSAGHLRALLGRFDAQETPVVASCRNGIPLPPALFARSRFERLMSGRGDRGAKALLAGAALVPASEQELADIDRPRDLRDDSSGF